MQKVASNQAWTRIFNLMFEENHGLAHTYMVSVVLYYYQIGGWSTFHLISHEVAFENPQILILT